MAVVAVLLTTAIRSIATTDVRFYDEAAYLGRGLLQGSGIRARFTDGAVYSDYYWLLSQISPDPIGLYFVGRAGAAVMFVLGIWLTARLVTNAGLAWAAAATAAAIPATYVWPSVAAPAAALILIGLALIFRFPTPASLGAVAGCYWLAAGARPEFIWLASVTSLMALAWMTSTTFSHRKLVSRHLLRSWIFVAGGSIVVPFSLVRLHGPPISDGGRNWEAFGQHFSLRQATPGEDPWLQWRLIVERSFPGAEGVPAALTTNPGAITEHVARNAVEAPGILMVESLGFLSQTQPIAWLLVAILMISTITSIVVQPQIAKTSLRELAQVASARRYRIAIAMTLLTLTAVLIPVLLIHPRIHYLLIPAALIPIAIVFLQFRLGSPRYAHVLPLALVAITFAVYSILSLRLIVGLITYPPTLAMAASNLAREDNEWRLLGVDWGLEVFVPGLEQITDQRPLPNENFEEFLVRNRVNVLLLNERFAMAPWNSAAGFQDFLADPNALGFKPLVAGSSIWVRHR